MLKPVVLCILALTVLAAKSDAQPNKKFVGSWEGKVNVGIELTIVVHIKAEGDSGVSSTLDSPDQSAFGLVADKTTIHEKELHFEIHQSLASFTGTLESDSVITGIFTQNAEIPVTLRKTNRSWGPPVRPQTPKPPFPYKSEDVEFDNADKTVHFGATFTCPNGKGPFITALLLTGSGQQDRDETILGHKPFAVIADYLTQKGYAVLRVDDRGEGKTTGDVMQASSKDFANDAMASMDYLNTRKEVNYKKIGLIGHSEGGLIASLVMTQRKDVAFIISLAGVGMKGADILSDQGQLIMIKAGVDPITAGAYNSLYKKIIDYSLAAPDTSECFRKVWLEYSEWKKTMQPVQLQQLGFTNDEEAKKIFRGLLNELYLPWMQFFNKSDASINYRKAYCPILALNGSDDIQVIPGKNLEGIRSALKAATLKNYEIKELPGLNHLFQHCKKCSLNEYAELEETFAPEALEIMGEWLQKNVK